LHDTRQQLVDNARMAVVALLESVHILLAKPLRKRRVGRHFCDG